MIEAIHYQNQDAEQPMETLISEYYSEVREYLPDLPESIQIYFGSEGLIPAESGVGGFAYSGEIITVAIDPAFEDKEKQRAEIRSTIFHEAFHIYQGFTAEDGPFSAAENAVYEGMASVFERQYTQSSHSWDNYSDVSEEKLEEWLGTLQGLSNEEFYANYQKWKFYHPELDQSYLVYKVGVWLVEGVLQKHKLDILDLKDKSASEVIVLYFAEQP